MLRATLEIVWLLLPAGIANSVPIVAARYNWLDVLAKPIDGGSGILGSNKTVRGVAVGTLFGSIASVIQRFFRNTPFIQEISLFDYSSVWLTILFGAAIGFGALKGDATKSFFKRRLHIPSGKPWRPFDQVDYVIGALIVAMFFVSLTWQHVILAIIVLGALSFATSFVGHALKIKKSL